MTEPTTETPVDETTETAETPAPKREPIPVFQSIADVPSPKPQFFVIESALHATTANGELRVPLFFPTKKIRTMPDEIGGNLEQVFYIFGEDSELCVALDELDITESHGVAQAIVRAYNEKQQTTLGE